MTPTSFFFTLTMPGDARLVEAVRLLAVQTSSYAQMAPAAGEGLASIVERETHAAIASTKRQDAPIELRFSGDENAVTVAISCDAAPSVPPPRSSSGPGVSVDWNAEGSRYTCHIRQAIAA